MRCDEHADCSSGEVCGFKGNPQTGFGVHCVAESECFTSGGGSICGKLCKTPTTSQTSCPSGTVCTEIGDLGWMQQAVGYKYCQ
jgi:hypothetical protein